MIEIKGNIVIINGTTAGSLIDAKANYPDLVDEIQLAWEEANPIIEPEENNE